MSTLEASVRASLVPTGVLRVGINTSNYLLVPAGSTSDSHGPIGVVPSLGTELARRLGVEVKFVPYASPGALADEATKEAWDVGFIGADPKRAEFISFTSPYVEIPASYVVRSGSSFKKIEDVDAAGVRIASVTGSAFDLWLQRHVQRAEIVPAQTMDAALDHVLHGRADVLAGLRDRLINDVTKVPEGIILEGQFMSVQQAVGVARTRGVEAIDFLNTFIEDVKSSGFVEKLLEKHGMTGRLLVAPPAEPPCSQAASKKPRLAAAEAPAMKIVVLGCGAMGSIYAGLLASTGNEVWVVDVWQAHIDSIRERGLRVEGASGDRTVQLRATMNPDDIGVGTADLVIIATKASGVASAAEVATKLLGPQGVILTIQNGLGAGDRIAQHVAPEKVLLGVASNFGASMKGPGHTQHASMNLICIGEMTGGVTERLQRVVDLWAAAGFTVKACPNINTVIWEKFICNCANSGSCTLTGMTVGEVQDNPGAWAVAVACAREAADVARAQGIPLSFDNVEEFVHKFGSTVRAAKPSMLQDHLAKRCSEIDAINGAVPVEAAKVGMSAPVNQIVADLIRARESTF
mmetsp:Transcript_54865/g.139038  ORF Transcript_54865/g.139038 Transcript_54865/m.139038 type:complete len:577 (-) Transcript_54865:317-2047(-)|eukprot:CAMPEP_0183395134 /NCGR_PEP_ID=MMETSP0370-20130417/9087_1 /TAXON_ID=268820 /ORGANISM="Peridinium aciculiferum, Strain PAER-2" /LENGTH=576 /DNA_ID=CAMNT_0025575673 /DNA_START=93 /DNA_END=1823 /DNA_ORIENTATION=+